MTSRIDLRLPAALLFAFAMTFAVASPATAATLEDDPLDTAVDAFKEAVSGRDIEVLREAMENLVDVARELDEKDRDRDKVAILIARLLDYPGREDNAVAYFAATLLGRMGKAGVKPLARALDDGDVNEDENHELREAMLTALGDTKHASAVPTLLEFLKNAHASAVIAAVNALANFGELDGRTRKKIVEPLIHIAEYVQTQTQTQRTPPGGRAKYLDREWWGVVPAVHSTLRTLTHENPGTTDDWREWFEKNKRKNWDKEFGPAKKGEGSDNGR